MEKIMIADDAFFMRNILQNTILKHFPGTTVATFSDGAELVDAYRNSISNNELVSLVLSDLTMPNKDGFAALEEIKEINSDQKFVICSSLLSPTNLAHGMKLGANHFLQKPYIEKNVIETIDSLLCLPEYDEYDHITNMSSLGFFRLCAKEDLETLEDYIFSGFDFSSTYGDMDVSDMVIKTKNKKVYDFIMQNEDKLPANIKHSLKGIRIRELLNLNWDGSSK